MFYFRPLVWGEFKTWGIEFYVKDYIMKLKRGRGNSRQGESVSDLCRAKMRLGEFKAVYRLVMAFRHPESLTCWVLSSMANMVLLPANTSLDAKDILNCFIWAGGLPIAKYCFCWLLSLCDQRYSHILQSSHTVIIGFYFQFVEVRASMFNKHIW